MSHSRHRRRRSRSPINRSTYKAYHAVIERLECLPSFAAGHHILFFIVACTALSVTATKPGPASALVDDTGAILYSFTIRYLLPVHFYVLAALCTLIVTLIARTFIPRWGGLRNVAVVLCVLGIMTASFSWPMVQTRHPCASTEIGEPIKLQMSNKGNLTFPAFCRDDLSRSIDDDTITCYIDQRPILPSPEPFEEQDLWEPFLATLPVVGLATLAVLFFFGRYEYYTYLELKKLAPRFLASTSWHKVTPQLLARELLQHRYIH